jgi:hypothetical protein
VRHSWPESAQVSDTVRSLIGDLFIGFDPVRTPFGLLAESKFLIKEARPAITDDKNVDAYSFILKNDVPQQR